MANSANVNVIALPPSPVITLLDNNVLHSDAPNGNQWYNQNGIINGAVNQDYTVVLSGDYYAIVTLLGCSSDESNVVNVLVTSIGTVEENYNLIKIYPNPVQDVLTIELVDNTELINFEILNALGQIVYKGSVIEKTTVQTAYLNKGIYLIKFKKGVEFEFKKMIKR